MAIQVVHVRGIKDAMRRRIWEMILPCGHYQYELFKEHRMVPKSVEFCRVCDCLARVERLRRTGETTYAKTGITSNAGKKKTNLVQTTLW